MNIQSIRPLVSKELQAGSPSCLLRLQYVTTFSLPNQFPLASPASPPSLIYLTRPPLPRETSSPYLSGQCLLTKPSGAQKDTTHSSSSLRHGDADDDAAGHQAKGHTGQLQAVEVSGADGDVHTGLPRALFPGLLEVLVFLDGCLLVGVLHPGWKLLGCKFLGC